VLHASCSFALRVSDFFPSKVCNKARPVLGGARTTLVVAGRGGFMAALKKRKPVAWYGYRRWLNLPDKGF
jgi:hypothetical protein